MADDDTELEISSGDDELAQPAPFPEISNSSEMVRFLRKPVSFVTPVHTLRLAATSRLFGKALFSLDGRRHFQSSTKFSAMT